MTDTFTLTGPILAPDLTPQVGARLTFVVLTGTDAGAHVSGGEIIGPRVIETDEDAQFEITLPLPSELEPAGSVIVCQVRAPRDTTSVVPKNTWTYVLDPQSVGTFVFGDVATLAMDDDLVPPGYTPVAGPTGPGVAAGGALGNVLQKASGADFDTEWVAPPVSGVSSVNGLAGDVILDAAKVGADPTGTAQGLVDGLGSAAHASSTDFRASATNVPSTEVDWDGSAVDPSIQTVDAGLDALATGMGSIATVVGALGSAANRDVPTSDNASDSQVMLGSDTRVTGVVFKSAPQLAVQVINSSGSQVPHTVTRRDARSVTFTAPVSGSAYQRTAWTLPGTYADVEVRVTVDQTIQSGGSQLAQIGLAARVSSNGDGTTSAFIADTNVFSDIYGTCWNALWRWDGASLLNIDNLSVPREMQWEGWRVLGVQRLYGYNFITLDTLTGLKVNDTVNVVNTADSSFNGAGQLLSIVSDGSVFGATDNSVIGITTPATPATVLLTPSTGSVSRTPPAGKAIHPGTLYPQRIAYRIVGTKASLKTWHVGWPEPPWPTANVIDFAAATIPVPTAGQIGLIVSHTSDGTITYSDLEVTRL